MGHKKQWKAVKRAIALQLKSIEGLKKTCLGIRTNNCMNLANLGHLITPFHENSCFQCNVWQERLNFLSYNDSDITF